MDPASRQAAPDTTGWSGWLRRPAVSMTLGFAVLILAIAFFSNGPTKIAPSASLQLAAGRGEISSTVSARRFELTLADGPRNGGPYRVEVVNAMGVSMWSGLALANSSRDPAGMHLDITQQLLPGDYFVRLHGVDGKVLREYVFRVR